MPKIGRKTKGGRVMTSKPLRLDPGREGVATNDGDSWPVGEAEGDSIGDGEAVGVGVAACSVKVAHGFGGTLAQILCTPGLSPLKGLMRVVKLPPASA